MNTVASADGTPIAYERRGTGPVLIVVDGALTTRLSGRKPELFDLLAERLTVYFYDRRGRGDSGDTQPYAVDREIDDIAALIDHAGGVTALYGHSSGGALALLAALALHDRVHRLAIYEVPYNSTTQEAWERYLDELTALLSEGRRGDAVALFMALLGTPAERIEGMRETSYWPGLEAVAPTLAYDHAGVMGRDVSVPVQQASRLGVPALLMYGTASLPFMRDTAEALHRAIPKADLRGLDGQTHDVDPAALAAAIAGFVIS